MEFVGCDSEGFAHPHSPRPRIPSLRYVSSQIDAICLAQLKSNFATRRWKNVSYHEQFRGPGYHFSHPTKTNHSNSPYQRKAVLKLGRVHIAIQILSSRVPTQFVVRTIDAIAVEGWFTPRSTNEQIVRKDLTSGKAPILVKCESVCLERIL